MKKLDKTELKWRELALQFDGHRMQALWFLKQILKELPDEQFKDARDFLSAGPLSGEEVLRNRIGEMADARLNHIRAEVVQKFWDDSLRDVGCVLGEIGAYRDASEAGGIVHSEIQERVEDFIEALQKGEKS